jgi:gamma-glutamylcyclotransferase (GGCT)/AIG2-like uncharacterized protein YtfP
VNRAVSIWYFAYGSNLCRGRLLERVSTASYEGIGRLAGHALRFHKIGRDGSGKADAFATGLAGDAVWGALVRVTDEDLARLDRFEPGYDRREVTIKVPYRGDVRSVTTYFARQESIDPVRRPYAWYRRMIVQGGTRRGLPADYLRWVAAQPATKDPTNPYSGTVC